jgi:hypothetical protein
MKHLVAMAACALAAAASSAVAQPRQVDTEAGPVQVDP